MGRQGGACRGEWRAREYADGFAEGRLEGSTVSVFVEAMRWENLAEDEES